MQSIILIFSVILAWSFIGFMPATLAGKRRRNKKNVYWLLLAIAIVIEVIVAVSLLQLGVLFEAGNYAAIIAPILASVIGGFFYWKVTLQKDKLENI